MRVYIITKGKTVTSTNDYGQAVVDAHRIGEGARITSVGVDLTSPKCVKVIHFPYPTK